MRQPGGPPVLHPSWIWSSDRSCDQKQTTVRLFPPPPSYSQPWPLLGRLSSLGQLMPLSTWPHSKWSLGNNDFYTHHHLQNYHRYHSLTPRIHSRRIHSRHYRHWNHRNLTNINISCSPKDAEEEDVASSSPPPFLSLSLLPPPSSISLMPCRRQYRCALKICLHHHHPHYCFGFWRREIIKVIGQKKKEKRTAILSFHWKRYR